MTIFQLLLKIYVGYPSNGESCSRSQQSLTKHFKINNLHTYTTFCNTTTLQDLYVMKATILEQYLALILLTGVARSQIHLLLFETLFHFLFASPPSFHLFRSSTKTQVFLHSQVALVPSLLS